MPEEVLCSASLVVDESEHLVLMLTPRSEDVHDKDVRVWPAGDVAQLEGDFVDLLYGWLRVKLTFWHKCEVLPSMRCSSYAHYLVCISS